MSKNKLTKWFSTIKAKKHKRLYVHNVSIAAGPEAAGEQPAAVNPDADLQPPEVKFELERTL